VQKTVDAFAIRIDVLLGDMIGRGCAVVHCLHLLILLPVVVPQFFVAIILFITGCWSNSE
jgi:hypothetical protein